MLDTEEYCDVCKAELKKGPQLVFAVDEEGGSVVRVSSNSIIFKQKE